jgi:hypothetical protein
MGIMNPTLLKTLVTLVPASMLFSGSSILFFRRRTFDAIIKDYDGSRDLLIEAKPDADKGSIRIAIGQLFDYARHRSRQPATDLVVLTIPSPAPDYIDLLNDLGITAIWIGDESCERIAGGQGKA